jgi:DNA polymerase III subunit delta'
MNPLTQTKLFGLNKYFNEIINIYQSKNMPNKILLSGSKGSGKCTLAYHIVNYVFSQNEEKKYNIDQFKIDTENKSFNLVKNGSHPNFYLIDLIDEKKNIEINQIREMISFHNKSSFNEIPRFVLIDNIEKLNLNSANALLKIIEEPNDNIFFILIHDSNKNILSTLKSRCLNFKINLSFHEVLNITNSLINDNLFNLINKDLINYYKTPGEMIKLINFAKEKKINLNDFNLEKFLSFLIDNSYYKKNIFIKDILFEYIELYFLKKYKFTNANKSLLNIYHQFIYKIKNTKKFNLDEESLFMEFKSKLLNE